MAGAFGETVPSMGEPPSPGPYLFSKWFCGSSFVCLGELLNVRTTILRFISECVPGPGEKCVFV